MPEPSESSFSEGGWRGEVAPFAHPHLEAILEIFESGRPGPILKSGGSRKVWATDSPLGKLLVKEYFAAGPLDRLARLLRGSRASREWIRLNRFTQGNVPTPEPILWAEGGDGKGGVRSIVVTRFIENSQPLDDFLRSHDPPVSRWKVARLVGAALARMHALGARHDDLHAGNLLVAFDNEADPRVYILDLHQVRLARSLTWNARLKNLASLYGGLRKSLTVHEKHHALQAYLMELRDWKPPFRTEREARLSMGRALDLFGGRYFRLRCRRRIRKCEEAGKRFQRISPGPYRGWIRSDRLIPELIERLADPNAWIDSGDCRILKHTPTTTVVRAGYSDKAAPLFLKRYNRRDWWEKTKNLFRPSRARKVWRAGYGLEAMGIPTPRVAAMLERRWGPFLLESFILTDWTEGGVGLDDFWNERCSPDSPNPLPPRDRRLLRKAIARLFADLHEMRISHGDLKGRNVLLDPSRPAPFAPLFVDLDALQMRPVRFKRSRVNDLSRLLFSVYANASLSTRVRFFKDYCGDDRELWESRRDWWGRIDKRTSRKLREKGLPL